MEDFGKQLLQFLLPDGKFSPEAVQQLAEFTKVGQQADQTINMPRLSNDERIELEGRKLDMLSPHKQEAHNRVIEGARVGSQLQNEAFGSQMDALGNQINKTLGLGYDSRDKISERRDNTHRYMIDDQSGHRDKDRELIGRQMRNDMFSRLGAGGLLLLDILKN